MQEGQIAFGPPLSFSLSKWWGYILSAMFILYGGFSVLMGVLDRDAQTHTGQQSSFLEPMLFLGFGILLAVISYEFGNGARWSWSALLLVNGGMVILATAQLLGLGGPLAAASTAQTYNIVLLVLGLAAVTALLLPTTKRLFSEKR